MLSFSRLSPRSRRAMCAAEAAALSRSANRLVTTCDVLLALCNPEYPSHTVLAANGISRWSLINHIDALRGRQADLFVEQPPDMPVWRNLSAGVEVVLDFAGRYTLNAVGTEHILRALIQCGQNWPVGEVLKRATNSFAKLAGDAERACVITIGSFVNPPSAADTVLVEDGEVEPRPAAQDSGTAAFPHGELAEVEKAIATLRAASYRRPGGPHTATPIHNMVEAAREFCRAADALAAITILPPDMSERLTA